MTNQEILGSLAASWQARRESLPLKKGTVKEREGQLNFMIGAVKGLELTGQPIDGLTFAVSLVALSGRDLVEEYLRFAPKAAEPVIAEEPQ